MSWKQNVWHTLYFAFIWTILFLFYIQKPFFAYWTLLKSICLLASFTVNIDSYSTNLTSSSIYSCSFVVSNMMWTTFSNCTTFRAKLFLLSSNDLFILNICQFQIKNLFACWICAYELVFLSCCSNCNFFSSFFLFNFTMHCHWTTFLCCYISSTFWIQQTCSHMCSCYSSHSEWTIRFKCFSTIFAIQNFHVFIYSMVAD